MIILLLLQKKHLLRIKNIEALRHAIQLIKKEYEEVLSQEENIVREVGGLHVIGTERHESRRVDN